MARSGDKLTLIIRFLVYENVETQVFIWFLNSTCNTHPSVYRYAHEHVYPWTFILKVLNMCQNYNTQLSIHLWMDKAMLCIENTEYYSTTMRNWVMTHVTTWDKFWNYEVKLKNRNSTFGCGGWQAHACVIWSLRWWVMRLVNLRPARAT